MSIETSVTNPRWQPGDTVVLRYITRDGRPGMAWPYRVVEDRDDLVALFIPRGATYKNWHTTPGSSERRLVDAHWRHNVLRLMFPWQIYSIWLFWRAEDDGRFSGYYVNFEEPFRRTPIGFDTNDHTLDIVVTPNLRWTWKDDEQFTQRVQQGIYHPDFEVEVRAEAARLIGVIESRGAPFSDGWERWTADDGWPAPLLPPTWNQEPATVWDRSRWAYLSTR